MNTNIGFLRRSNSPGHIASCEELLPSALSDTTALPNAYFSNVTERVGGAQENAAGMPPNFASAEDLLPDADRRCTSLNDVIENSVSDFRPDRIQAVGPYLLVGSEMVAVLSLVLHELLSNSARHGALSREDGFVHIYWTIKTRDIPTCHFCWIEFGRPTARPDERHTFAPGILLDLVRAELGGQATAEFSAKGLRFEIVAPLANMSVHPAPYVSR